MRGVDRSPLRATPARGGEQFLDSQLPVHPSHCFPSHTADQAARLMQMGRICVESRPPRSAGWASGAVRRAGIGAAGEGRTAPGQWNPTRHSGHRHARPQPQKAKRSTDSVGGPSCRIEVKASWWDEAWPEETLPTNATRPGPAGESGGASPDLAITRYSRTSWCGQCSNQC